MPMSVCCPRAMAMPTLRVSSMVEEHDCAVLEGPSVRALWEDPLKGPSEHAYTSRRGRDCIYALQEPSSDHAGKSLRKHQTNYLLTVATGNAPSNNMPTPCVCHAGRALHEGPLGGPDGRALWTCL